MKFKKVSQGIFNKGNENIQLLEQLFPTVFKDGEVDFEALKAELGMFTEAAKEKYQLNWSGKQNAMRIANEDIFGKTLKLILEDSHNADTTENIYIEGDNLEVLKLLRQNYYNSIKVIYIDPPYNTGHDFIYSDSFAISTKESAQQEGELVNEERLIINQKSGNRFHANWLNMIYPRLKVAKDMLSDDGVCFISIGQDEVANLKNLCDEIFGSSNWLGTCSRLMKSGGNKGRFFSPNIDYVLIYAKNSHVTRDFKGEMSEELVKKVYNQFEKKGQKKGQLYRLMGLYQSSLDARTNQRFWIECPDGTLAIPPGDTFPKENLEGNKVNPLSSDGVWRWTYERYCLEKQNGNIEIKKSKNGVLVAGNGEPSNWNIYTKIWLKDRQEEGQTPVDIITKFENRHSAKELIPLDIPFDFAKPSDLIKYLLFITQQEKDITILDFFSGSASTAHAVMKLNAEDGGKRKFIMVQLPELCAEKSEAFKAGYKTISEIGKERIRRAGEKIKAEFEDRAAGESLDSGFKVYQVANTNIRWTNEALKGGEMTIKEVEMNDKDKLDFMPNATDIDVVYEIILRQRDVPLSCQLIKLIDIGERTYLFADRYLVCLEVRVTAELVEKLAIIEPLPIKFIFRDSAFEDNISLKDETVRYLQIFVERNSGKKKKAYTVEFL
ncbi:site-specific DNA-methyltransferase [Bacillaceae bacterium IKA-2]|nr:site-specific DNA-methyltransferase [Bacillaceae bacterium IKA-2]